jgi:hypothetical protein
VDRVAGRQGILTPPKHRILTLLHLSLSISPIYIPLINEKNHCSLFSANFMVVTTILFAHTTFLWVTCCLICFIPIVKPFLTHWSLLRVVPFIERGNRAHGGCDRSTGDAYSSIGPDPTSDIFRGLCTPILWFVFPIRLMRLITDRYFCHFILTISLLNVHHKNVPCM